MLKTITAFKHIFRPLCNIQKTVWQDKDPRLNQWVPSQKALETYDFVSTQRLQSLYHFKEEKMSQIFSSSRAVKFNFFDENLVLYLPPLGKGSVYLPILTLRCKFSKKHENVKFRVMLVTHDKKNNSLKGIGFRMETPEGKNSNSKTSTNSRKIGIHDFYHAQLIQQFSPKQYDNKLIIEGLNCIPEAQPSFPMPANCPVTLLLCLILTLYGINGYEKLCRKIRSIDQYLNIIDPWLYGEKTMKTQNS